MEGHRIEEKLNNQVFGNKQQAGYGGTPTIPAT